MPGKDEKRVVVHSKNKLVISSHAIWITNVLSTYKPIIGTNSGVAGVFSAIIAIKIENVSSTVRLNNIFSDALAGSKKTAKDKADSNKHGTRTLTT